MTPNKLANNMLDLLIDPTVIPVKQRVYFNSEEKLQNEFYEGTKLDEQKAYGDQKSNSDFYPNRNRQINKGACIMDRKSLIASLDILSKNFTENDPMAKDLRTIACAISKMQDTELASRMASDAPSFEGVIAAKTFKCPTCGTNVLEQTGYCVKCKKKVKKACMCGESTCEGKCEDKDEKKEASVDFWSKEASDRVAMALVTEVVGMNQNERAEKNWPSKGKAEKDAAKVEPEVEKEVKPEVEEKDAAKKVEEPVKEEVKDEVEAAKKDKVEEKPEEELEAAKKEEVKPEEEVVEEKDAAKKVEEKEIEEEKKSTVDTDILASMTYGDISMTMPGDMLSTDIGAMTAAEKEMLEGLFTKD
jgi:flagellar biosynthesis GTPase FlhF